MSSGTGGYTWISKHFLFCFILKGIQSRQTDVNVDSETETETDASSDADAI
jgi:hypothetical protein